MLYMLWAPHLFLQIYGLGAFGCIRLLNFIQVMSPTLEPNPFYNHYYERYACYACYSCIITCYEPYHFSLIKNCAKGPSTYYVILHTVFYVKRVTFFLVNRVEHQKLNQTTAELPFGWVFGVQLGLRQTQALIRTYYIIIIKEDEDKEEMKKAQCAHPPPFDNDYVIGTNQWQCLPKAEFNTKNSTKQLPLCGCLVKFFVFTRSIKLARKTS